VDGILLKESQVASTLRDDFGLDWSGNQGVSPVMRDDFLVKTPGGITRTWVGKKKSP